MRCSFTYYAALANFFLCVGVLVLQILVPIVVAIVLQSSTDAKPAYSLAKILHAQSMQALARIGSQYPQVKRKKYI